MRIAYLIKNLLIKLLIKNRININEFMPCNNTCIYISSENDCLYLYRFKKYVIFISLLKTSLFEKKLSAFSHCTIIYWKYYPIFFSNKDSHTHTHKTHIIVLLIVKSRNYLLQKYSMSPLFVL